MDRTRKETFAVQFMLGVSIILGFIPPLIMYIFTRQQNRFYRESSRRALNFHLTIFPFFAITYVLPSSYVYLAFIVLLVEVIVIVYAMIRIAMKKAYRYPAVPFIREIKH
ncbi:protein of unknown function [Alteribacillus persepolensis]|uniref:DUF4870 domain-containing protein n=1 Tax=Alteribacillus persepolensis TaxID=568899 RepID=A0A1G8EVT4_9BACI|nr:DUF4870 domain-containing protein [Alteribacillus persepolensis]SDH73907.1 protein of unknown function [Alteribacillus persepolensis]